MKGAWVTLATNDSYSLGALVLAHSLKQVGTVQELAVLVTPGVTNSMRARLSEVYNLVQEVNVLDSNDKANLKLLQRPELGITFTKLHCWQLTQYEKCVFLDADTLVLQNCDELFQREELSAAPDVGWPDCFNSGVFVYKPSNETYDKLVQFAIEKGSFDGGDQGLLNLYFNDWASKDISKHLPFIYNVCSAAFYSYLPAFKQYGKDIKIIHFIGNAKPWLQYFDTETRRVRPARELSHLDAILQKWWNIFCYMIHPSLTSDMSGLAGAFAKLTLGQQRTPEQEALEHSLRRQNWEQGNIDYLGRDSFDNIWSKICETLAKGPQEPAPSEPQRVEPLQPEAQQILQSQTPPPAVPTGTEFQKGEQKTSQVDQASPGIQAALEEPKDNKEEILQGESTPSVKTDTSAVISQEVPIEQTSKISESSLPSQEFDLCSLPPSVPEQKCASTIETVSGEISDQTSKPLGTDESNLSVSTKTPTDLLHSASQGDGEISQKIEDTSSESLCPAKPSTILREEEVLSSQVQVVQPKPTDLSTSLTQTESPPNSQSEKLAEIDLNKSTVSPQVTNPSQELSPILPQDLVPCEETSTNVQTSPQSDASTQSSVPGQVSPASEIIEKISTEQTSAVSAQPQLPESPAEISSSTTVTSEVVSSSEDSIKSSTAPQLSEPVITPVQSEMPVAPTKPETPIASTQSESTVASSQSEALTASPKSAVPTAPPQSETSIPPSESPPSTKPVTSQEILAPLVSSPETKSEITTESVETSSDPAKQQSSQTASDDTCPVVPPPRKSGGNKKQGKSKK